MRLLIYIDENAKGSVFGSQDFISRAIEYINCNITEDISIDKVCSAVHTSKYYFCRQFKKTTGLTVANYILKTRIVMAKNMLLNEEMTVGEVSEKCGFSSISYFCRVFKEDVGISPKQYKFSKTY
jgi:AraC-like DNA-binding protein